MEDFIPFEIAKKLREKGFREKVNAYYGKWKNLFDVHPALDMNDCDYRASAPTISQVLKWLREKKNIFIVVFIDDESDYPVTYNIFRGTDCVRHHHGRYFALSEWSECEMVGIEYVIDNLI